MTRCFMNDGVESLVFVGGVVYFPDAAVWFNETVVSFYWVTIPGFVLRFDVVGVWVVDFVFKRVSMGVLQKKERKKFDKL